MARLPIKRRREARGVWTSYPATHGSGSKTSLPRRPGLNNQASPAAAGDTTDRSARLPCSVRLCRRLAFRRSSPPRTAAARGCTQTVHFTYAFQARALYEHNGYELVGCVEDFPSGTDVLWYRKRLKGRADGR